MKKERVFAILVLAVLVQFVTAMLQQSVGVLGSVLVGGLLLGGLLVYALSPEGSVPTSP